MGKRLNALIGRSSAKATKLKKLSDLAASRIAILKKIHTVRFSQEQSDALQLLQLGHKDRALARAEQVIKERNTLDAFAMIESYCSMLRESSDIVDNSRECPEDLKEAIASIMFAASRCGEFPELQQIRVLFTSIFGKEFDTAAVHFTAPQCGVNPKIIQRLSSQQASMQSKRELLKQLATDNGIFNGIFLEMELGIPNAIGFEHES